MGIKCALRVALCFWAATGLAWGAGFKAGVTKVDITPPPGLPMYGYFDRTQLSAGTLDPLYARILVIEVDGKRLALITLDLGRTFGPASLTRLRIQLATTSGISCLLITASHTHAGPNILDEYPANQPPAWEVADLDRIAKGVEEARQHEVEAQLGTGFGSVYIGYNRRRVQPDGTVTMFWQNPDKVPTSPLDPTVSVLRVDATDGKPIAILVNYACHPVVFGPDNLEYSADYVGVMARTVEQSFSDATGGPPLCLFLQGGDGDINPYYATTPRADGAVKKRDWTGEQLGAEAARVAKSIHTAPVPAPSLQFSEDYLTFPVRWDAQKFRQGMLAKFGPKIYEDHADLLDSDSPRRELALDVTTILLNKQIALMGMPGEPFVDFQVNWRARCPAPSAFFVGYANGYYDYFPTVKAASEGGYGAADSDTYIAVGAGERMVNQALVRIYEMMGQLSDVPED
ncbi:MAG: neutral/alkaline non-lysosomal ceramidase N-terminal domain-containing protein [Terriglobia bacterium]